MQDENRSIFIALHKAQVQVDQGPQRKTKYMESNRREGGKELRTHCPGGNFLNRAPIAQALRSMIDKWDLMKLKSFCKTKDTVNRTKQQPTYWEKIFTNPTSNRGLISIYTKNSKLDSRQSNNRTKNEVQS